jgi:hypothetical protein
MRVRSRGRRPRLAAALVAALAGGASHAAAATLEWKGHTWQLTSGGMAGVCQGSPSNVTVDANGYLHLKISNDGGTWTASEMFTTDRLGFGTYQWHVDGPIDVYDKNVVLGLFPYGPIEGIGADGTNEIDIEFSRWGNASSPNADWTDYPSSGKTIGELTFMFTLGGAALSTSRLVWSKTSITSALFGSLQPVESAIGMLKTWTYAPPSPITNIPQQPLPLGMNLWCFGAPPSDGKPVEIVIRDFQFVPQGAGSGAGGHGGAGGGGHGGAAGGGPGGGGGTSVVADGGPAGAGAQDGGAAGAGASASAGAGGASAGAGGASNGTGGASNGAAGAPGGTRGSAGAGGASAPGGHATEPRSGGCSVSGGSGPRFGLVMLLLACAAFARRRR